MHRKRRDLPKSFAPENDAVSKIPCFIGFRANKILQFQIV